MKEEQLKDPFDQAVSTIERSIGLIADNAVNNRVLKDTVSAAIWVNDTLRLAVASSKSNFEGEVKPEVALAVLDLIAKIVSAKYEDLLD